MEGIILRSLEMEDLHFLYAIENDPQFWHLSQTTTPFSIEDLKSYIHNAQQPLTEALQQRFVISNATRDPLGFIDLYDYEVQHKKAGVGILVHPQWQEQGVGTQALNLLLEYAPNNYPLDQLYALVSPENVKSLTLFQKCGFEKSVLKKDCYFYNNQYHDMWLFQKIVDV